MPSSREPDPGLDHLPELLPHVRQAVRHDRHGRHRAFEFQQIYGSKPWSSDQPPDGARTRTTRSTAPPTKKWNAVIETSRLPRARPAGAGRHDLDRKPTNSSPSLKKEGRRTRCSTPSSTRARRRSSRRPAGSGAVTIATNMAGRGTDIVLGGNVEKPIGRRPTTTPTTPTRRSSHRPARPSGGAPRRGAIAGWPAHHRHRTPRIRRIDNQLRGRSGRQGDQGSRAASSCRWKIR